MVLYKEFKIYRDYEDTSYNDIFIERLDYKKLVNFGLNKSIPIHNWYSYKQGFSQKLVVNLINEYKIGCNDIVLDPFCGVGTTPLTCKELGISSIGNDISPLSTFISKAKCDYDKYNLDVIKNIIKELDRFNPKTDLDIGDVSKNKIDVFKRGFEERRLSEILSYKEKILSYPDELIRQFLQLGLIKIVEASSNTIKDGAFIRYVNKNHSPTKRVYTDTLKNMYGDLLRKQGMNGLNKYISNEGHSIDIITNDSRNLKLPKSCVDFVVTSPPYLNRYDYTRIYMLELYLFFTETFDELRTLRYNTIRSHVEARYDKSNLVDSSILEEKLSKLSKRKLNNARIIPMISGYFDDMYLTFKELKKVCSKGAIVSFVVGNTRFSGVDIPVDIILLDIGKQLGYTPYSVWVTRYKGNTPQQIKKYGLHAVRESIVFLKNN